MKVRYHLIRLSVVGVTRQDADELGELARLAFQGSATASQVASIKQRTDVSPLAFAIADIVDRAQARGNVKMVMLGAVLGAYTGLRSVPDVDELTVATLGAVGGAVAASTSSFICDNIETRSWADYVTGT